MCLLHGGSHQVVQRVQEVSASNAPVIDVDGSYLYRKQQQHLPSATDISMLPVPAPPLMGWESVTKDNVDLISTRIPWVTQDGHLATITKATCECAAGESASCTHVSGLLHALVAMCPSKIEFTSGTTTSEDPRPVTSYPCQWKQPHKRKDSSAKVSELAFHKHVFGQQKKHTLRTLSDFDPRPPEQKGTAPHLLKDFLTKVKGKGLGVSLLFDNDTTVWKDESDLSNEQSEPNAVTELPTRSELMERVTSFKESLKLTTQQIQELDLRTREQHKSELWFSARRYRLTASIFGAILRLRPSTPPDSLVKQLLHQKEFSTQATIWGKENEDIALETYMEYKKKCGNNDLITCNAGFVVCEKHSLLGASPDAYACV
ncbi:hypothetical protein EMCRGX_G003649 [Ephydatia muelleri]